MPLVSQLNCSLQKVKTRKEKNEKTVQNKRDTATKYNTDTLTGTRLNKETKTAVKDTFEKNQGKLNKDYILANTKE